MPLARMRLNALFIHRPIPLLTIIHMLPEIIQLRLVELRRQLQVPAILQPLERGAHAGHHRIALHAPRNNPFKRLEAGFQLVDDGGLEQEVVVLVWRGRGHGGREDVVEERGDVVGLDYAAIAPDFHDGWKIDVPSVLLVRHVDDTHPLHICAQTRRIHRLSKILDKRLFLLVVRTLYFCR